MNTLLIDDDPLALLLLQQQLQFFGIGEARLCAQASDAVDLLRSQPGAIDVVFCDLQMPGMDGIEFMRHLAQTGYRGGLVLVSGEDDRVLQTGRRLAQAHQIELLGTLRKPVSIEQLQQVLARSECLFRTAPGAGGTAFLPAELDAAIAGGQLLNHYQPKVDLRTGALVGVETQVRWQHPQAGLVYPDRFIAAAEAHGLMDRLTHAVLAAALSQARAWREAGLDLQLAVNISIDSLVAMDFPDVVAGLAQAAGVPMNRLVLEVSESRLIRDARALDIVARLRLKGLGLSIVDFGTGHSSLTQLRDLPFDEIKLDRSFVNGVAGDASQAAIVQATLAMARQLGMKSVAAGIEARADSDFLRAHGCDEALGCFIAGPMPGAELPAWHDDWQQRASALLQTLPATCEDGRTRAAA